MNVTRAKPLVVFEGTKVASSNDPPRFIFTTGTAHLMSRRKRGFTLLEVLLAVMVFAIVLAAASTVFYGALRLRNGAAESLEQALPGQHAFTVIRRDLANLVVPDISLYNDTNFR